MGRLQNAEEPTDSLCLRFSDHTCRGHTGGSAPELANGCGNWLKKEQAGTLLEAIDLCRDAQIRPDSDRVRYRSVPIEIVCGVHITELKKRARRRRFTEVARANEDVVSGASSFVGCHRADAGRERDCLPTMGRSERGDVR